MGVKRMRRERTRRERICQCLWQKDVDIGERMKGGEEMIVWESRVQRKEVSERIDSGENKSVYPRTPDKPRGNDYLWNPQKTESVYYNSEGFLSFLKECVNMVCVL
jgi:hypothetical protein